MSNKKSFQSDSNRWPTHYECVALPTELHQQIVPCYYTQCRLLCQSKLFRAWSLQDVYWIIGAVRDAAAAQGDGFDGSGRSHMISQSFPAIQVIAARRDFLGKIIYIIFWSKLGLQKVINISNRVFNIPKNVDIQRLRAGSTKISIFANGIFVPEKIYYKFT